jgi:hypothetical protein
LVQNGKYLDSATALKPALLDFTWDISAVRLSSVRGTLASRSRYRGTAVFFRDVSGGIRMLMGALITFLVVILILYLINLLPLDGRAKQIARVVVIILGIISLLKYIAVF